MNRLPGCSQDVLRLAGSFIIAMAVLTPAARGQCLANELIKLTSVDAEAWDSFGYAVAISGDIAVIGAMRDDTEQGGYQSGTARVYRFDGTQWIDEAILISSDIASGDWFGHSVAVSGDAILVGAPSDGVDAFSDSGAAFVFRFNGSEWVEEAKLTASDYEGGEDDYDVFGYSVSLVGNVAIVGAPRYWTPVGTSSAYVYRFDGSDWIEEAILTASDEAEGARFGNAVAVSGDVVLVGALNDDHQGAQWMDGKGATYVYRFDPRNSQWNEEAKLTVPDPVECVSYRFGMNVSLDGNVALIGSEAVYPFGCGGGGQQLNDGAYVFRFDPEGCQGDGCSPWVFETKLESSDLAFGDRFGFSVAIEENLALVGAWGEWSTSDICSANPPTGGLCNAGSAYVFAFDGTEWVEQAKLNSSDIAEDDRLGWSVALSGETALVGAFGNEDAGYLTGSAYFFGGLADCNNNDVLDLCDIVDGNSDDNNNNGIPDECDGGTVGPGEFSAFRGFYVSGDLDSLLDSDDSDLCYEPGIVLNPTEAPITLDFLGTLPNDSPASLDVTIESSANTVGLELTISFWNFNTNSWDVVGTAAQSLNADTVRTFAGIPVDHVEPGTGEVRTRYEVRVVSFIFLFPWTDCVDQIFWTFS